MRQSIITIALAAMLVSRVASAAGDSKDPSKGASPAGAAGESPAGGGSTGGPSTVDFRDRVDTDDVSPKVWDVGVGFEYHHLLTANDLEGAAVNQNVNYYAVSARWDITKYDRLAIAGGLYQYFLADQGESGARLDDLALSYTRRIPLPGGVTLRVSPGVTLPTSYGSQLAGIYVEPVLGVSAEKRFGRYFSLDARMRGVAYIVKATSGGGTFADAGLGGFSQDATGGSSPNPEAGFSMRLAADFTMPFHEPLSINLLGYTSYTWFYDIGCSPPPMDSGLSQAIGMMPAGNCTPASAQAGQPAQQKYGYEISLRYQFPTIKVGAGIKTDATFTFAPLGDPTLGYTSVVRSDGSAAVYGYYRLTAEVYAGLSAHY